MILPNRKNAMAAVSTAHMAAAPDSNAVCATPIVDFDPMNSDISRTPMTMAGVARPPTMNSLLDLLRSFAVSHDVTMMYSAIRPMMIAVSVVPKVSIRIAPCSRTGSVRRRHGGGGFGGARRYRANRLDLPQQERVVQDPEHAEHRGEH